MTDIEYRALQQKAFFSNHKQYKVYLVTDTDKDVISVLEKQSNKSAFIRQAILAYVGVMNIGISSGKWIRENNSKYPFRCSECSNRQLIPTNICLGCGASMPLSEENERR